MHPSVSDVVAAPRAGGAAGHVRLPDESARTAAEAAAALGVDVGDELLRRTGGRPAQVGG